MNHIAARKDENQTLIVEAMRKAGVFVTILSDDGVPDLLCGYPKTGWTLLEVKNPAQIPSKRKLKPKQEVFFAFAHAVKCPVFKIETIADAFAAVGIEIQ